MPTFDFHKHINAGPDVVFDTLTNLTELPDIVSGISKLEVLTDEPLGKGTKFRETRVVFGREATEVMEFIEYDPPNRYVLEANSHGSHYLTVHEFKASVTGGTDLTMQFNATPNSLIAKVMGFLMAPLFKKTIIRCFEQDLEELKRHAEGK